MSHGKPLPEWAPDLIKITRLIQGSLMMSVLCYGAVAHFGIQHRSQHPDPEGMQMIFSILGLGACFAASIAHRVLLKPLYTNQIPSQKIKSRLFMGFLVTWMLAEACAAFGLVLAFRLGDPALYHTFGILAFLTILAHPVTEGRIRSLS